MARGERGSRAVDSASQDRQYGIATLAELPYQFSHADLAQMFGVRRETITRAMGADA